MIGSDSVMVILSPRLLLEIDINATGPVDHWHVRDGISKRKYKEFRIRALRNSFKEILFSDRASLEEWRASPECSDRIRALGDKRQLSRCLREAAARVQWALGGFGRVPVGFEDQIESHFRALNENS